MTTTAAFVGPVVAPELTSEEFHGVATLLHTVAGISLAPGKEGLVRARLSPRLRTLGLPNVRAYLRRVEADQSGRELALMIDVLTTNKTSFFREPDHFAYLRDRILPELATTGVPVRIWSAGCSSGEEAVSLAILVRESGAPDLARRARVLGTDISRRMLAKARHGTYAAESTGDVPAGLASRHFERAAAGPRDEQRISVIAATRSLITFARLNLMASWPMRGPFDVIFCRNVMIYFDRATQQRLVRRFAALLAPGGHLFVGHSESLTALEHGLQYVRPAVYQR